MPNDLNFEAWTCPLPLRDHPNIIMGHGGGGMLSADLVRHLFLPAFSNDALLRLGDGAVFEVGGVRLAMSTDSYVVRPLFFPGGNIGELAVNGTVNDLAMMGATPLYLSAGFIVEEGLAMDTLGRIVASMGEAARRAGVQLITGDTKVVDRGHGDGVYINTSGIGVVSNGVEIGPERAQPGDAVLLSGTIGDHGMAVMSVREGLEFEAPIRSDTAPLNGLVAAMLAVTTEIHVLRDPTRGGVASALNEIAQASQGWHGAGRAIDPGSAGRGFGVRDAWPGPDVRSERRQAYCHCAGGPGGGRTRRHAWTPLGQSRRDHRPGRCLPSRPGRRPHRHRRNTDRRHADRRATASYLLIPGSTTQRMSRSRNASWLTVRSKADCQSSRKSDSSKVV